MAMQVYIPPLTLEFLVDLTRRVLDLFSEGLDIPLQT